MKKIIVVLWAVLCSMVFGNAFGVTLYRMPLSTGHVPTQWFDHNDIVGQFLRYDGSTVNNYDQHKGTDFASTSGYGIWSGSSGTVVYTLNTCSESGADQNCGGGFGNHVRVLHPDGKVSVYAHMKPGSVAVTNGESVLCSRRLGNVGKSGLATGYHLHFVVWSDQYATTKIDQFGGTYSNGGFSYWVNQNGGSPTTQCQ